MSKIGGFFKSLKIQIAGFWKQFFWKKFLKNSKIIWKQNQLRRYCKMHIILFSETNLERMQLINLERMQLIKSIFLKIKKMKIAGFWKSYAEICSKYKIFSVYSFVNKIKYYYRLTERFKTHS